MRYEAIRRHRDQYPIRLMCRCLKVSPSGFHGWASRSPSARDQDNARLLAKIREHHASSDGVMGAPRMHEVLGYEGETASLNRIARLMADADLSGVPQKRRWRHKRSDVRPAFVRNHLARDFTANEPNTKWVVDITYIRTAREAAVPAESTRDHRPRSANPAARPFPSGLYPPARAACGSGDPSAPDPRRTRTRTFRVVAHLLRALLRPMD